MEQKRKASYDFLVGIITIVFGLIYGVMAYNVPRSPIGNPLSPSMFPLILAGSSIVLGVILTLKSKASDFKYALEQDKAKQTIHDIKRNKMIVMSVASGILYTLMFQKFGYVISTFVFMIINLSITERDKWVRNLIIALVFSVVVYYVFFYILGISLPITPIINW